MYHLSGGAGEAEMSTEIRDGQVCAGQCALLVSGCYLSVVTIGQYR